MYGPIDYLVVSFKGNKFNGEILTELESLIDKELIKILDLTFITKDAQGNVGVVEFEDMPQEVSAAFADFKTGFKALLSENDIEQLADMLEPNSSAGALIFEHVWARDFKQAIAKAGGELVVMGRVDQQDVEEVENELG